MRKKRLKPRHGTSQEWSQEMESKIVYLAVTVEEKEEDGRLPRHGEVAVNVQDMLCDVTKHELELPWRVTRVTEVHVPGTGIQVGSGNYQHDNFG